MVNRIVSVGDDFTLPPAVKVTGGNLTPEAVAANLPARLEVAALDATIGQVRALNTIAYLGDSLTEQGGLRPTMPDQTRGNAFWPWAQSLTGYRLKMLTNAGVGGDTTAQMLARLQADVIALGPGWCHVLGGTNDIGLAVPTATTTANLTAILDALDAANVRPILGTVPPRAAYTGTMRADTAALNAWIKEQGRTRRNLTVVDYHAALTDPATGQIVAGYAVPDGIHLTSRGGYAGGRLLADAIKVLVPAADVLLSDPADPANLLGTAGRFPGGVGAVPDGGWFAQGGTPTYSKTPRTDGIAGSWQTLTNGAGIGVVLNYNRDLGAGLAVGDTVQATVEYDLSALETAATQQTFMVFLQAYDGASFIRKSHALYRDSGLPNHPSDSRRGVLTTPPLTVPEGAILVQMVISCESGGTYHLDRADIRKI